MRVLDNKHLSIDYFSDRRYFKVVRLSSSPLDDEEYKELLLEWRKQIEFYHPKLQMVNYLNYYKPIPPYMQNWISENLIKPAFEAGMKKVAFIISRDLYMQVSLEQTMQEEGGKMLTIKYFDNEISADNWLND